MARKITEAVIIGDGSMGQRHATNLINLGVKIAARADPLFAHPFDLPSHYSNSIQCLDDKAKDRLVVVASPSHLHAEHAINALYHGAAAVYIEKPMTVNTPDAYEIQELAEELGIPVTVGYNFRMHPGLHLLFQSVQAPNYWFGAYGIDDPTTWPTYQRFGAGSYIHAKTGGLLWTSCSHAIDMALAVHGRVETALAGYSKTSSAITIRLQHGNNGISSLYNKWKQGSSPASLLTYTSPLDTMAIDLLAPSDVDVHHTFMSNFLQRIENPKADVYLPTLFEAVHGVEVLVAVEQSIDIGKEVIL